MSATRKTKPDADGPRAADFYPTPAWAVDAVASLILDGCPVGTAIYDCGAGEGAILRALARHCSLPESGLLRGCEIRGEAAAACRADGFNVWTLDWLKDDGRAANSLGDSVGAFVMNPPYGGRLNLAQRFVHLALERATPGTAVWALLRMNLLLDGEVTHSRQSWLRNGPGVPDVFALNKRPSFTGDGRADATTYAWMRWAKGAPQSVGAFRILDCHEPP